MNADRLARYYRTIEYLAFGRTLEEARFECLAQLNGKKRILVLGEGDGRFASRLLQEHPGIERIDIIESSARMVELAQARLTHNAAVVHFQIADARAARLPTPEYDAIVTNFFLDCLSGEDARQLIERCRQVLAPSGVWTVTEFQVPGGRGWRRVHARIWIFVMYLFFRLSTGLEVDRIPNYTPMLRAAGFERVARVERRFGLIVSEIYRREDGREDP